MSESHFGCMDVAGKVSGRRTDCLLTTLTERIAERVAASYQLDAEDVQQDLLLHVLRSWKWYRPEACSKGAAIRRMAKQGVSRVIKNHKKRRPQTSDNLELSPEEEKLLDFEIFTD